MSRRRFRDSRLDRAGASHDPMHTIFSEDESLIRSGQITPIPMQREFEENYLHSNVCML